MPPVPRSVARLAWLWVAGFAVFAVLAPLAALLVRARGGAEPSAPVFSIAVQTVTQAGWSTAISVLIGLPLGLWAGGAAARGGAGARAARMLLAVPFGVPTVVAGMAGIAWLGRTGILAEELGWKLDWAYSMKAVILAHVFLNAPWTALLVAEARAQIPPEQLEAARTLGAGAGARFRLIHWPYVRFALAGAAAQVFSLCVMSFALVLLLGGGPPVQTLETAIYARIRYGTLDLSGAIACALWELGIALGPWALVLWLRSRARRLPVAAPRAGHAGAGAGAGSFAPGLAAAVLFAACAIWVVPYLVLATGARWSLLADPAVTAQLGAPLAWSAALAAAASVLAVLTALAGVIAASEFPAVGLLLSLPSGISVLVLGLGLWLAYGRWIDPFEGSFAAMAVLQATLFSPVAFRMLWPVAQGTQRRLLEAAATLGASPGQAFLAVEWPRWRGPVLGALGVVAGASLGEVAAVSLFYSEKLVPLPLLVTRWMSQYRFAEARAASALLLVLSAGAILWAQRFAGGFRPEER